MLFEENNQLCGGHSASSSSHNHVKDTQIKPRFESLQCSRPEVLFTSFYYLVSFHSFFLIAPDSYPLQILTLIGKAWGFSGCRVKHAPDALLSCRWEETLQKCGRYIKIQIHNTDGAEYWFFFPLCWSLKAWMCTRLSVCLD